MKVKDITAIMGNEVNILLDGGIAYNVRYGTDRIFFIYGTSGTEEAARRKIKADRTKGGKQK